MAELSSRFVSKGRIVKIYRTFASLLSPRSQIVRCFLPLRAVNSDDFYEPCNVAGIRMWRVEEKVGERRRHGDVDYEVGALKYLSSRWSGFIQLLSRLTFDAFWRFFSGSGRYASIKMFARQGVGLFFSAKTECFRMYGNQAWLLWFGWYLEFYEMSYFIYREDMNVFLPQFGCSFFSYKK